MINPTLINMMRNMAGNNQFMNNALDMAQKGDYKGVETLARNLCISNGLNPDEEFQKLYNKYNTK